LIASVFGAFWLLMPSFLAMAWLLPYLDLLSWLSLSITGLIWLPLLVFSAAERVAAGDLPSLEASSMLEDIYLNDF